MAEAIITRRGGGDSGSGKYARGTVTAGEINPQSITIAGLEFEPTGFALLPYSKSDGSRVYNGGGSIFGIYKNGSDIIVVARDYDYGNTTAYQDYAQYITFEYADGVYTITQSKYDSEYYEGYGYIQNYWEFNESTIFQWIAWREE